MTTFQNQVAVEATIAQAAWGRVFRAAMDAIAGCFARREARATAAEMVTGLLTEVDTRNCWTLAEALGHPGPHRLQHLLSRARFDHDRAQEEIVRLIARELAGQDVVLVADETGDAKSSTDCVGAGRQYSGAIKGVGLCQVAVHLAAVTESVRVGIDRALYLPADWAADEERREMAGVPEEIMFATKLQQAAVMVKNALELGVRARWFAGDEVYSGRELRRNMRELGLGYAVGVSQTYTVMDGAGRRWKARQMVNKVQPPSGCACGPDTERRAPASTTGPGSMSVRTTPPTDTEMTAPVSWSLADTGTPARSRSSAAGRPKMSPSPIWWK
ncbi:transposase [Streptomyces sp. NPDC052207]|uniref:IS701 family transposase n=1 Tax=Streptomyces sp. NPDC052207 TaxID=3155418 RepID=UPI0034196865